MFSQVCFIPSVHGGRVSASGFGCVCTPPAHPLDTTVNKRAVLILLECFLIEIMDMHGYSQYTALVKGVDVMMDFIG